MGWAGSHRATIVRWEDVGRSRGGRGCPGRACRRVGGHRELTDRIAGRCGRVEVRHRLGAFVLGLLADLPRKNCWTIAEHVGDATPGGMQHLLGRAGGYDGVGEDLRDYVVEHLGDAGAVLVIDETGDLKKGRRTVGVHRQYTGTAGRIENTQVAVCLPCAAERGHALIDRQLYLPRCWTAAPDRCAAAGVPADLGVRPSRPANLGRPT